MSRYSKTEMKVMDATFKSMFKVNDETVQMPSIQSWMENAAVGIVEYEGTIKGERSADREQRMEIVEVYDGDISVLVSYLRRVFRKYSSLSKWELLFKIYSGIEDPKESIDRAVTQLAFGHEEPASATADLSEAHPSSQSASKLAEEEVATSTETEDTVVSSEASTVAVAESATVMADVAVTAESEEKVKVETDTEETSKVKEEAPVGALSEAPVDKPSGNGRMEDDKSLFNTQNNSNMEDKKMSNVMEDMMNAAAGMTTAANPAAEQKVPAAANVASKGDDKEAQAKVAAMLAGQKGKRNAWVRENVVTALVSTQAPAALRTLANEGIVTEETDAAKAKEEVLKKALKYINAVAGKNDLTIEAFEALSDDKKYANLAKPEQIDKAKAIYELYKQMLQNPTGKFAAFIPSADKCSYPTKGYMMNGSTPLPETEFTIQLIDNGNGVIYGEGSIDESGKDVGDKPVTFTVSTVKRVEKNQATGVSTAKKATRKLAIRPKNKKEFIKDANRIVYLFEKVDENATGKANFKAAIQVAGELQAATVSVFSLENGQKKQRGKDKEGNPTYKTRVAGCNVSVPVKKITKEFGVAFRMGDEDTVSTASRWGVQIAVKTQKGNFGDVAEISMSPVFDVFTEVYAGKVSIDGFAGSQSLAALKAAADQQAAETAAASASELE